MLPKTLSLFALFVCFHVSSSECGKSTKALKWPWLANLKMTRLGEEYLGKHERLPKTCGGALINDKWVVTYGLCLDRLEETRYLSVEVVVGEQDVSKDDGTEVTRQAQFIILNDDHGDLPNVDYDDGSEELARGIALIRLNESVDFKKHPDISPVCLVANDSAIDPKNCVLTNRCLDFCERFEEVDDLSLRETKWRVTDEKIARGFFKAVDTNDTDLPGDVGSPLVCRTHENGWALKGITRNPFPNWELADEISNEFVDVMQYRTWINDQVRKYEAKPKPNMPFKRPVGQ